jgi:hypothetical protein
MGKKRRAKKSSRNTRGLRRAGPRPSRVPPGGEMLPGHPGSGGRIEILSYQVTDQPMADPDLEGLPAGVLALREELRDLLLSDPEQAISRLEELTRRYPDVKVFHNFLCAAHARAGHDEAFERLVREALERWPEYLSAKIQYAQICLGHGRLEEIPKIFDGAHDLGQLHPERKLFHATEISAFAAVMASYYLRTGNLHAANLAIGRIRKVHPEHRALEGLEARLALAVELWRSSGRVFKDRADTGEAL